MNNYERIPLELRELNQWGFINAHGTNNEGNGVRNLMIRLLEN